MTTEQWTSLLTAVAALVSSIAWPAIVAILVWKVMPGLLKEVRDGRGMTLKGMGFEATFAQVSKATAALSSAEHARTGPAPAASPAAVANAITDLVPDGNALARLGRARVLWVDDHPENNHYEQMSLEALGIQVVEAKSTDDALDLLDRRSFDVVISDMGRGLDQRAGYTLLAALRKFDQTTPFLIYAGSDADQHRDEAIAKGAQGSTNSPRTLIEEVIRQIRRTS